MRIYNTLGMIVASAIILFFPTSCEEDEEKDAHIETTIALTSNATMQGKLTIEKVVVNITDIGLTASSGQFTTENNGVHTLQITSTSQPFPVFFNGGVGVYDPLTFSMSFNSSNSALQFDQDEKPILNSFISNAKPSMMVFARYENRGQMVPVYIAIDQAIYASTNGTKRNSTAVSLGTDNRAIISLSIPILASGPNLILNGSSRDDKLLKQRGDLYTQKLQQ